MASITSSLEQSLQNCSLNQSSNGNVVVGGGGGGGVGLSATSDTPEDDNTLELNSHVSLPYQWEQCLDLKTGEIYFINWMNGAKVKEDPRNFSGDYYTEEDSSYDSEGSSSESSPSSSSRETFRNESDQVLVVAGCKSCLMYFMLPKRVEQCPKCNGLLLHFDRSENDSP